jgi:hypothetical protein
MRFQFGHWWQQRKHAKGFKQVIPGSRPLDAWPDAWFSLQLGHWHFWLTVRRQKKLPEHNPALYDNVP